MVTPTLFKGKGRDTYVVMGVAGSGKSLVGAAFAHALGVEFVEGDDFHPIENVTKMASGTPLSDEDRAGWLRTLAARLETATSAGTGLVMSCSALKRAYRDVLRAKADTLQLIFLRGSKALIAARLANRKTGHFMPPSLLDSQFATLEEPDPDECAWVVDITRSPDEIVSDLVSRART